LNTSVFVDPSDIGIVGDPTSSVNDFSFAWSPVERFTSGTENTRMAHVSWIFRPIETFIVEVKENNPNFPQHCSARDTIHLIVSDSYRAGLVFAPDSVCLGAGFPIMTEHTGAGDNRTERWYRYDTLHKTYLEIPNSSGLLISDTMHASDSLIFRFVGSSELRADQSGFLRERFYDTLEIVVKSVPQIIARITQMELVEVVNQIKVIRNLKFTSDSVKLGERVRFIAQVHGRNPNFPYYNYEWMTYEDLYGEQEDPFNPIDYAGFDRTDTTIAISGLIFAPQKFYFYTSIPNSITYGCESMDSVYIRTHQPRGIPEDFGKIPGGFSPSNNDGINDIFMKGVDEITILNRWGMVIFESKTKQGWNGRDSKTNRMVDKGDYFYIITIYEKNGNNTDNNNTKHTKTGVVTVF
jgi:hypothetical protein